MSLTHWHEFDRHHWRQTALRWGAVGVLVLCVHAALVYGAMLMRQRAGETQAPPPAVMIELAPVPVSAPNPQADVAPGPQMVQSADAAEAPDAPDPPQEKTPEETPLQEKPLQEKPPQDKPPEATPEPAPPVTQEVPKPLPSPVPSEVVLPPPKPEFLKTAEPKAATARAREAKPEPRTTVRDTAARRKRVERKKPRERETKASRRQSAPATSAAPRSSATRARQSAAPTRAAGASPAARASWAARVSAHLNRYKRYPSGARGASGRPSVRFSVNGAGRVTSVGLTRSSGNRALDAEAVATVRRASPFPRPPDGRGASFSVPISFVGR